MSLTNSYILLRWVPTGKCESGTRYCELTWTLIEPGKIRPLKRRHSGHRHDEVGSSTRTKNRIEDRSDFFIALIILLSVSNIHFSHKRLYKGRRLEIQLAFCSITSPWVKMKYLRNWNRATVVSGCAHVAQRVTPLTAVVLVFQPLLSLIHLDIKKKKKNQKRLIYYFLQM